MPAVLLEETLTVGLATSAAASLGCTYRDASLPASRRRSEDYSPRASSRVDLGESVALLLRSEPGGHCCGSAQLSASSTSWNIFADYARLPDFLDR